MFNFSDVDEVVRQSQICDNSALGEDELRPGCSFWNGEEVQQDHPIEVKENEKKQRYRKPEEDQIINDFSRKKFAPQSRRKIKWAVNLYNGWRTNRIEQNWPSMQIVRADLNNVSQVKVEDLCYSLCRFVREIRKLNRSEYPPNTIRELVIMIQMYLNECGICWKLLDWPQFVNLRNVVDNTMKERHSMGLGVRTSAEVISLQQENLMFESGVLGEDTPIKLLRTVIYMVGLHCALRGGVEHSNLRRPGADSQFKITTDDRGKECLVYQEDPLQKTNQGGLEAKGTSKKVQVYAASNSCRCPIRLFKKYVNLLPESLKCKKLYLRVRKRISPKVWYCDQPYGINKIKSTVKDICKMSGIDGKFTNHSLRATCASRMFAKNVPEQIIKEITGHRSECVRTYKRTSDKLKEKASRTLSVQSQKKTVETVKSVESGEKNVFCTEELSVTKMIENVNKTKQELRRRKFLNAKARLSLKKYRRNNKFTIDLNLNVNK